MRYSFKRYALILLGMLLAAEVYVRRPGAHQVFCAKYHHHNNKRCIFRCNFQELAAQGEAPYAITRAND